MELKIKKLKENAKIPARATEGSAGMDLYACIDSSITINPNQIALVPTGIAIELPDNSAAAFLYARSGTRHKTRNLPCKRCRRSGQRLQRRNLRGTLQCVG